MPTEIHVDNGPEFISKALDLWGYMNGVTLEFSRSEKPTDNTFIESFNGKPKRKSTTLQVVQTNRAGHFPNSFLRQPVRDLSATAF